MAWKRTGDEPSRLEKIVGALEMIAGGLTVGFLFSPWGDRYIPTEAKPFVGIAAAGLIAKGRMHYRHTYEPDEQHPHAVSYMREKFQEHEPRIRGVMEYVAPRAERLYANWRARPRYA